MSDPTAYERMAGYPSRSARVAAIALALAACTPPPPKPAAAPKPAPATPKDAETFAPPLDTVAAAPDVPRGRVAIELRDADDQPVPHAKFFLAQIAESWAPNIAGTTDAAGRVTLDATPWIGTSARVVQNDGQAEVWTDAFPIGQQSGVRAVLHTYASSSSIDDALVVFQCIVFAEWVDGRVRLTQRLDGFNFGRIAWLPKLTFALPAGANDFASTILTNTSMNIERKGDAVWFAGTLSPGRHTLEIEWSMAASNDGVHLRVTMPPHLARVRVVVPATASTLLEVAGLPAARREPLEKGAEALVTERELRRSEPALREIELTVAHPARAERRQGETMSQS